MIRNWTTVYLTVIFLALAYLPSVSQGILEGVISDSDSGNRLAFVHVTLVGTDRGIYSDESGSFRIENLEQGVYNLEFSCIGYESKVLENIEIRNRDTTFLSIEILPSFVTGHEVIVTATSKAQSARLAPASIGLITSRQLEELNVSTFDQAFEGIPGVIVTRSSGSNVQAFSIRGASEVAGGGIGNRVLLLIDGRPALSPESGGALWNLVPVSSIERIEVVKGAYSSLYGSSAMGGVVNVLTRKPTNQPQSSIHLNYGFYDKAPPQSEYDNFGDYYTLEFSQSRKLNRFSYLIDGSLKTNDGHREKSSFDLYNLYGKLSYDLGNGRSITWSGNRNHIKNDTPATWLSTRNAYSVAEFRKDDFQDRREINTDLYYQALPNAKVKYSSRTYYYRNYSQFSFNGDPTNDSTNVNTGKQLVAESSVKSNRLGNVTQIDFYPTDNQYLIGGIDFKWDNINGVPDTVLYGKHEALSLGLYIQDEITFNEKVIATMGIRLDHYNIIGEFREWNFSPKIAMLYQSSEDLSFRLLLAQAFRNPAIAERFIKFEQGGGLRFLPNPDLKSENLKLSFELGSKYHLGKQSYLDISLFYNRYNNLISFQQKSQPLEPLLYEVVNLKEAVMQGIEVSYRRRWKNFLFLDLGYAFLDARDVSMDRVNDDLAYKVAHSFSFSSTANWKNFSLNLNGRYRSEIKEVFIYPGNEPDAAFVLNSRLSYGFGADRSLYLAIGNLNNELYEELERYRMPGRSYSLGMMWQF